MLKLQSDRQAPIVPSGRGSCCLAAIPRGKTQEKGSSAEPERQQRAAPHLAPDSPIPKPRTPLAEAFYKLIFGFGGLFPPACLSPACPPPVSRPPALPPPRRAAHSPAARSGRSVAHTSPAGAGERRGRGGGWDRDRGWDRGRGGGGTLRACGAALPTWCGGRAGGTRGTGGGAAAAGRLRSCAAESKAGGSGCRAKRNESAVLLRRGAARQWGGLKSCAVSSLPLSVLKGK